MAEKPPSREALQRGDKLISLIDHPGLDAMVEEATMRAVKNERTLVTRSKSEDGVTHAEWRYWAGFEAGMEYLLNLPNLAQKKLDKINNPAGSER